MAPVAQWIERLFPKQKAEGSTHPFLARFNIFKFQNFILGSQSGPTYAQQGSHLFFPSKFHAFSVMLFLAALHSIQP
jgi:hypothetical protein